jgi:hypothetical protein
MAAGGGIVAIIQMFITPSIGFVEILPQAISLNVGDEEELIVNQKDTKGNPSTFSIAWSSDKASIASISNNGIVTAHSEGRTFIRAKVEQKTKIATVTVIQEQEDEDSDSEMERQKRAEEERRIAEEERALEEERLKLEAERAEQQRIAEEEAERAEQDLGLEKAIIGTWLSTYTSPVPTGHVINDIRWTFWPNGIVNWMGSYTYKRRVFPIMVSGKWNIVDGVLQYKIESSNVPLTVQEGFSSADKIISIDNGKMTYVDSYDGQTKVDIRVE